MIRLPQRPIRSFATSVCAVNKASKRAPIPKAPKKTNRLPPSELAAAAERAEKLRESALKQAVAEREFLATKAQRKAVIDREASSARVAAQRAEADRLEEVVTEPVVYEPAAVVEEAPGPGAEYGKSETIYTGQPSFSVPLVLTAALVFAVFAMNGADMARVGYADWDEEKQEYELAPTWKRYLFAAGFGGVGIGVTIWAVLIPARFVLFPACAGADDSRIVTKMSIRRPTSARPTQLFPQHSLVTIHTPLSKLPFLRAREVPISNISLLGPLSTSRRSYHPRNQQVPPKPPGVNSHIPLAEHG